MYAYEPILRDLERRARASYARQMLDPARPDHGAFLGEGDGYANPDHTANAKDIASACYCFPADGSALAGDDDLSARIGAALACQRRWQRPTGLIDLVSVNWESPPDTGFTAQLLAPVVQVARERAAAGDERAGVIAAGLGEYVRTAAAGMIGRGFHTPNHRWVVCSGLAQAMTLFPELPAREWENAGGHVTPFQSLSRVGRLCNLPPEHATPDERGEAPSRRRSIGGRSRSTPHVRGPPDTRSCGVDRGCNVPR